MWTPVRCIHPAPSRKHVACPSAPAGTLCRTRCSSVAVAWFLAKTSSHIHCVIKDDFQRLALKPELSKGPLEMARSHRGWCESSAGRILLRF